ncbi:tetratricopeptide repeat protein [Patescibacteria group bacterium]|nr:tetratricopeptide repeat protein [Patescibacteria group bacterium]
MNKNESPQSKISFRQRIILVLFGLFLFFVLLEASLRLGGFILLSMQEHRNLQSIKQKSTYRILCLGESTTQGQYPQFLEQVLNQHNIGVRFSVVDKGMGSTNTPKILSQVESYLNEYHPDTVVTMMGINDEGEHIPFEVVTTSKGMLLIRSFRAYKLTRLLWLHILTKAKEVGFYKPNEDRRSSGKVQTYLPEIGLKEDYAESILTEDSFKKAIELNPKNDNAYVGLGWLYKDQGKLVESEQAFKKATELNPKNDSAYVGLLGQVYRDQVKYPEAELVFKKAIELNPKNDNAYVGLGWIYRGQGKFSQAEDSFKKAIGFNPKNYLAYAELGWLYRDQGKFSPAEDSFKKAMGLNPKNDNAYRAILGLYEEIGKPELAKEYAKKVNASRLKYYSSITVNSYHKLKAILDKRGIKLVCAQYPMRSMQPLKKIFERDEGIIFVDNESVFKEALRKSGYQEYFSDMFGGDFGHCTQKGNRLLAQNIADTILKEIFGK